MPTKVTMPKDESVEEEEDLNLPPDVEDEDDPDIQPDQIVEDMNPDEELWPGGPTAGQIVEWKNQYKEVYITSLSFEDHVVWRVMNRGEYRAAMQHMERLIGSGNVSQSEALMDNEEIVTETCLLFPKMTKKDFAGSKAGLPTTLSQQILEASGFNPIDIRLM